MSSPKYYDGEAVFVYPNESKRLTLKEVPFVPESQGQRTDFASHCYSRICDLVDT
jgi:hypothetical protein